MLAKVISLAPPLRVLDGWSLISNRVGEVPSTIQKASYKIDLGCWFKENFYGHSLIGRTIKDCSLVPVISLIF